MKHETRALVRRVRIRRTSCVSNSASNTPRPNAMVIVPAYTRAHYGKVVGPAFGLTEAIDREFYRAWSNHYLPKDRLGNWRRRDIELLGCYLMMDFWLESPAFTEQESRAVRTDPAVRARYATELVQRALARLPDEGVARLPSVSDVERLGKWANELAGYPATRGSMARYEARGHYHDAEVKIIDQTSSAGGRINDMAPALESINRAGQTILIENPYLVSTKKLLHSFEEGATRYGVQYLIGTNSPLSTDSDITQAFFLEDWPRLLARTPNARIFVATGQRKFHAKNATVDGKLSLVTTYNLDFLSTEVQGECGAVIWSMTLAEDNQQRILDDEANRENGVLEYTIERHADGTPVFDERGEPTVKFGPQHHLCSRSTPSCARRGAYARGSCRTSRPCGTSSPSLPTHGQRAQRWFRVIPCFLPRVVPSSASSYSWSRAPLGVAANRAVLSRPSTTAITSRPRSALSAADSR